ncbi:hypothetical protein [Undibacterium sp. KW1]|uniref:hypothetical protein n=1 Tax=Undibacterium sp. KW1 TaxID=2058624 RepID=UPI00138A2154|nr:hypothetical protein [Undibacterium sp. KW1]
MKPVLRCALMLASLLLLNACSPKFDWRDARGSNAPFSILMPGKPLSDSKDMQLEGIKVKMDMLAGEVGGISFAVGSTKAEDAGKAGLIMEAMKKGMINNIQGTPETTKSLSADMLQVHGKLRSGQPVTMVGRFLVRGPWVYQIIMLGQQKDMKQDVIDTYMTSFKSN